ncbi:hypothetical protein [Mycolicibacterium goodii]|uniref:Uncharacterized protein n=1 Tax=Mycolicibacterium goodii TaxID=134601 RepID=A0ABS6HZ64_MYCGD|nr:hypothetical protein [Mycolicibacterium goodii]MBU8827591.1 hypothetical protein [Mycolicibacterium goodii]MBU8841315.1 hypothetical protein [Mycolicibacterium goodii]ULN50283.1 hypothetical protein MI170_13655 [Mycolicibacterium goodii]
MSAVTGGARMTRRKRQAAEVHQFRPPFPPELGVYDGAAWGAPPLDGGGPEWEAEHRAAHARFQQAGCDWFDEHGHLPVDPSIVPGDVAFCGDFYEHNCGGEHCIRRPARTTVRFADDH